MYSLIVSLIIAQFKSSKYELEKQHQSLMERIEDPVTGILGVDYRFWVFLCCSWCVLCVCVCV